MSEAHGGVEAYRRKNVETWYTETIQQENGQGVNMYPRGFSVSSETSEGSVSSRWSVQSRYMMAVRSGPTAIPDHILVNHPHFPDDDQPSPYSLYYYDVTAPNVVLLENDVKRDFRLKVGCRSKKTSRKYYKEAVSPEYVHCPDREHQDIKPYSKENLDQGDSYAKEVITRHYYKEGEPMDYVPSHSVSSASNESTDTTSVYDESHPSHRGSVMSQTHHSAQRRAVPDLRKHKHRDLTFTKKKLFFNVGSIGKCRNEDGLVPASGNQHLPQYSVSYQSYPNIAYDVIQPVRYDEFYQERMAPGFFTNHKPTPQRRQK